MRKLAALPVQWPFEANEFIGSEWGERKRNNDNALLESGVTFMSSREMADPLRLKSCDGTDHGSEENRVSKDRHT